MGVGEGALSRGAGEDRPARAGRQGAAGAAGGDQGQRPPGDGAGEPGPGDHEDPREFHRARRLGARLQLRAWHRRERSPGLPAGAHRQQAHAGQHRHGGRAPEATDLRQRARDARDRRHQQSGRQQRAQEAARTLFARGLAALAPQTLESTGATGISLLTGLADAIGTDMKGALDTYERSRIGQRAAYAL